MLKLEIIGVSLLVATVPLLGLTLPEWSAVASMGAIVGGAMLALGRWLWQMHRANGRRFERLETRQKRDSLALMQLIAHVRNQPTPTECRHCGFLMEDCECDT